MIHSYSNRIFVGTTQRLDVLTARKDWAYPDAYVRETIGEKEDRVEFNLSLDLALTLAKGLTKAVKQQAKP